MEEYSEAVGKVVMGCAVCKIKRYQFKNYFGAPSAANILHRYKVLGCFYPEDEIFCSVLDMPWAAAFSASFCRKIQLYQRKKTQPYI